MSLPVGEGPLSVLRVREGACLTAVVGQEENGRGSEDPMFDLHWSASEKKVARRVYDEALSKALATIVTEFKAKAAAVVIPSDMWAVEAYLRERRQEIDEIFDYRYSRLPLVFANLINRDLVDEAELTGLAEDKLKPIRSILSALRQR